MALSRILFAFIRDLFEQETGVRFDDGDSVTVEARLTPLTHRFRASSVNELIDRLSSHADNEIKLQVIDALLDTETSFFRDLRLFEFLRTDVLPALSRKRVGHRPLRIWSAACAMGQEVYSLAMLIRTHFPDLADSGMEIMGSDVCRRALATARAGLYDQIEINRGLPARYLVDYFHHTGPYWAVNEPVRQMVTFREINLVHDWVDLPKMDLIFLRNVLGHFSKETMTEVLRRATAQLCPEGQLFLGQQEASVESVNGLRAVGSGKTLSYVAPPADGSASDRTVDGSSGDRAAAGSTPSQRAPESAPAAPVEAPSGPGLANLISNRDSASLDEIVQFISADQDLKDRLLRTANRGIAAGKKAATTVEQALMLTGMGYLIVAVMRKPLISAVQNTFDTMLSLAVKSVDPTKAKVTSSEQIIGSAKFGGKATGIVHFRIEETLAKYLAGQMLGMEPEQTDAQTVRDVIGELINMIAGSFKSNISDAGLACKLEVPEVSLTADFRLNLGSGDNHEQFLFQCQDGLVAVDVVVNSMA